MNEVLHREIRMGRPPCSAHHIGHGCKTAHTSSKFAWRHLKLWIPIQSYTKSGEQEVLRSTNMTSEPERLVNLQSLDALTPIVKIEKTH